MKKINRDLLDQVSKNAIRSERLRMNYNFHESFVEPIQRMLNAMEPDTYLPPHRHLNPDKEEIFIVLRGRVLLLEFNDDGDVISHMIIDQDLGNYGAEVHPGVWHTLISLKPGTVIYEVKQGPFSPISPNNIAPWAPDDSSIEAKKWMSEICQKVLIQ